MRKLLVPLALVAVVVPPASAAARPAGTAPATVSVAAGSPAEFRFKISKAAAPKGAVVFRVSNSGMLPHDFKIAGKRTPLLQPGKAATLRVTFARAGAYPYLCTVPGHAAAGMKGVFRVR